MARKIDHGNYTPLSCGNTPDQEYDTLCNITCDNGYDNSFKNNSIRCTADKMWTHENENLNCSRKYYVIDFNIIKFNLMPTSL